MTAELAGARAATGGYVHANAAFDDELGRLRLLEARYDPRTFARLSMFGPLAGTRCLEVGAGAGSVAILAAALAAPPAVRRPIPARNLRRSMSQVSAIFQAVSKLVTIRAANKANKL